MPSVVTLPATVLPVLIGAPGAPTRRQAQSKAWRTTSTGRVVPVGIPRPVEQRIVEVGAGLGAGGMVTGWAALRLQGCGWFDGLGRDGSSVLPVPVRMAHRSRKEPGGSLVRRCRSVCGVRVVAGVVCADPETAVLDEMERAPSLVEAVVVVDMAAAGRVTSIRRVRAALDRDPRRRGRRRILEALGLADEHTESPQETRLRLTWMLEAGLPRPLVNVDVLDRDGVFVCRPDLLDVESGTMGEYDGEEHRSRGRHRSDEARIDRAQRVGLARFTVVAGDAVGTQVARMRAARERARWLPEQQRDWVVVPREGPTLDAWLDYRERCWGWR